MIVELYGYSGGFDSERTLKKKGVLESILNSCKDLKRFGLNVYASFSKIRAAGSLSNFWKDPSVGQGVPLKEYYPRLFAIETNKDASFKDRWVQGRF